MATIEEVIFQASATIFGGALIYAIVNLINIFILKPYSNFKNEVIKTKIDLLFYKNILTNAFEREETNDKFIEEILSCQKKIREQWSKLSVKYHAVPKLLFSWKLPSIEDMHKIEENLIYLSNRFILKSQNRDLPNDCAESENKVRFILNKLSKTA